MTWGGEQSGSGVMCFTTDGTPSGIALGSSKQLLGIRGAEPAFINDPGPQTSFTTGTPNISIGTAETAVASGTITPGFSTSNICVFFSMDLTKDSAGATATLTATSRLVTTNLRRGLASAGNQISDRQVSPQSNVRSQTQGGTQFGPAVCIGRDAPASTAQQLYTAWCKVDATTATGVRYSLLLQETQ